MCAFAMCFSIRSVLTFASQTEHVSHLCHISFGAIWLWVGLSGFGGTTGAAGCALVRWRLRLEGFREAPHPLGHGIRLTGGRASFPIGRRLTDQRRSRSGSTPVPQQKRQFSLLPSHTQERLIMCSNPRHRPDDCDQQRPACMPSVKKDCRSVLTRFATLEAANRGFRHGMQATYVSAHFPSKALAFNSSIEKPCEPCARLSAAPMVHPETIERKLFTNRGCVHFSYRFVGLCKSEHTHKASGDTASR